MLYFVTAKLTETCSEYQQAVLKKAIGITQVIPEAEADGKPDGTWTNTWHWVLSYVSCPESAALLTGAQGTRRAVTCFSPSPMVVYPQRPRVPVRLGLAAQDFAYGKQDSISLIESLKVLLRHQLHFLPTRFLLKSRGDLMCRKRLPHLSLHHPTLLVQR